MQRFFHQGKWLIGCCVCLMLLWGGFLFLHSPKQTATPPTTREHAQQRIVVLSPSLAEVLGVLGLGEQVVGISRYTTYPKELATRPIVGSYLSANYEAIVALRPSIVILLVEQKEIARQLKRLSIPFMIVDHRSIEGIMASIDILGKHFRREAVSQTLLFGMELSLRLLKQRAEQMPAHKNVLLCIERDYQTGHPEKFILAGAAGVHQAYLKLVGAHNVYEGSIPYPQVSREWIMSQKIDMIIELIAPRLLEKRSLAALKKDWQSYKGLKAVDEGRIFFLYESIDMVPGPRFLHTIMRIDDLMRGEQCRR